MEKVFSPTTPTNGYRAKTVGGFSTCANSLFTRTSMSESVDENNNYNYCVLIVWRKIIIPTFSLRCRQFILLTVKNDLIFLTIVFRVGHSIVVIAYSRTRLVRRNNLFINDTRCVMKTKWFVKKCEGSQ